VSHPAGLPDLFLDRSLGRIKVPALLRAAGLRLRTLSEHYGIPADEGVADEDWLELAGSNGWVVFMKDARVRYNRAEREAVKTHQVRCFCLSSQSLDGEEMAARFLRNLTRITLACQESGPFIFAVHKDRIERLPIGDE
jgi:hypothetical protein